MGSKLSKLNVFQGWKRIKEWFDRVRQDRNVIVFLAFLVISTGFWFLNALRKEYTATLSYPVKLVNIPEKQMLPEDFKSRIEIKVRAGGFVILRYQLSNTFLPLTFDVSQMTSTSSGSQEGVFAVTNEEQDRIVGQLSQGMELIEVNPDTLFVPLIHTSTAKLPVRVKADLGFEKQFLQSGNIIIEPDSVELTGPRNIIDTMTFVYGDKLTFENLSDTVSTMVPLKLPAQVKSSVKKVLATIPVEPFTELNLRVPLKIRGLPDSLRIKTFPSEIQVSFRVGMSKYESISENQFQAIVDVTNVFAEERPNRLKVRLDRVPKHIESLSFSPIFVEYLLEKKR
ncbi:YbbR-like domain-containing protein [Marinilabilia sp.]